MRSIWGWLHNPRPIYGPQLTFGSPQKTQCELTFAGPNMANTQTRPQLPPARFNQNQSNPNHVVPTRGPHF